MHIERIAIERFGRLREFEAELDPGLNVIKGANEAGKSTLRAAVAHAFFTSPTTIAKDTTERRSWGSDELFRLALTLCTRAEEKVELVKDFQAKTARLAWDGQETVTDLSKVEEALLGPLGLRSQKLYESTACVPQEQVADIESGRAEISDLLQEQVSGGADSVSAEDVLKQLGDHLRGLRRGVSAAHKTPGPIRRLRDEADALAAELAEATRDLQQWEQAEDVLRKATGERDRLREELESTRTVLARVRKRRELQVAFEKATGRRDELDERVERIRRLEQAVAEADPAPEARAELRRRGPTALVELARLETRAEERERQSQEESAAAQALRRGREARPPPTPVLNAMAAIGAVLMAVGIVAGFIDWRLLVMAVPGLVVMLWGLVAAALRRYVWQRTQNDLRARRRERESAAEEARDQAGELRENAQGLLRSLGCQTKEELQARIEAATDAESARMARRSELEGALGGQTREEIEKQYADARRARRDLEDQLEELAGADFDPIELQRLENGVAAGEEELGRLDGEIQQAKLTLAAAQVDREGVAAVRERLAAARERLEREERRARVCALTLEVMEEAHLATLRRAAEVLAPRMGELLAGLTLGRYERVQVDEGTLNIGVWSEEKGDEITVQPDKAERARRAGELSAGTLGQVFLAARLALVDLIWPDDRPPLLLDDPLVTFDPQRRRAALRMLQEYGKHGQVLLFTCSAEYDRFADRVVALP